MRNLCEDFVWLLGFGLLLVVLSLPGCASEDVAKAKDMAQQACAMVPAAQIAADIAKAELQALPPGTDATQAQADMEQAQRVLKHFQAVCGLVAPQ